MPDKIRPDGHMVCAVAGLLYAWPGTLAVKTRHPTWAPLESGPWRTIASWDEVSVARAALELAVEQLVLQHNTDGGILLRGAHGLLVANGWVVDVNEGTGCWRTCWLGIYNAIFVR